MPGPEERGDGSETNRRTSVSANPTVSAKTTLFFFRPPPSLLRQLRGSEATGEEDCEEDAGKREEERGE